MEQLAVGMAWGVVIGAALLWWIVLYKLLPLYRAGAVAGGCRAAFQFVVVGLAWVTMQIIVWLFLRSDALAALLSVLWAAGLLSWLVLGRSSAGAADAALLQQAALALLSGSGRGITGELADALGLDELSFKGGENGVASGSVTLGKRFSRNFYVAYERGLDATMGTLYFFYDISRRLKLRGETGTESAIDLIYTISYD